MLLLQITFSILLSCLFGYNNPDALSIVIIGAILPNIDESDRYCSNWFSVKGFTHSLLLVILVFICSSQIRFLYYVGIGMLGHIFVELFSKDSKILLFFPINKRIHVPIFHQNKFLVNILTGIIVLILINYINLQVCIDILAIYISWIKEIVWMIINLVTDIAIWVKAI